LDIFGNKQRDSIISELQNAIGILTSNAAAEVVYKGNPYPDYASATKELSSKFDGKAKWGNQLAKIIVIIRTAFIMGGGIKISKVEPGANGNEKLTEQAINKTYDFIRNMFELNDIDEEVPIDFAIEAEIEGKFLCHLVPIDDKKSIDFQHISWEDNKYKIITEADNKKVYEKVTFSNSSLYKKPLEQKEFVYKRFGGRMKNVNDTTSVIALSLRNLEDLDKALWDLRRVNHLNMPTPHFKCDSPKEAKNLWEKLLSPAVNWKIGTLVVSTAEFSLVGLTGVDIEPLLKEITKQASMISGTTGVPVHYLGIPELLSNRATAENLMEVLYAVTAKDRKIWIGAYEEIINKSIAMANEKWKTSYVTGAISVDIPFVTPERLKQLSEIWLPMWMSGLIRKETMLKRVPDVDEKFEMGEQEK